MFSRPAPALAPAPRHLTVAPSGVALLHLGLDKVRGLNAAYGWRAVDVLLGEVARELRLALPRAAPIALGQDRFELKLVSTDERSALAFAESARSVVADCVVVVDGGGVRTTASVGVAVGRSSDALADLRVAADLALAEAKRAGGDRATSFVPVSRLDIGREHRLIAATRTAVEAGRIVIHAQPVVALTPAREVRQWELFARLPAGDGALVSSADFLPFARRAGLIEAIDRAVSARAIERLSGARRDLVLEVNVSAASLRNPALLDLLNEGCAAHAVEPDRLILDVSEHTGAEPQAFHGSMLAALQEAGFRIALDNFGRTGGSLEQLRRFAFDFVKFDACFVRNLRGGERDRRLLTAAAQLARALGARPVACFVPDEATLAVVRASGVDLAQGFHLGRPRPFAEIP